MKYEIILADPPWLYYGDPNKNAAAGKHYKCMKDKSIFDYPVPPKAKRCALFLWATCPKLDLAISTLKAWGFHYRGVAYVWVKTRKDGGIINGQGIPPTFTKPTTEFLLAGSSNKRGRTGKILIHNQPQVIFAPRTGKHSGKPAIFRDLIVDLLGDRPRIELFARQRVPGWDAIGDELEDMPGGRRMA